MAAFCLFLINRILKFISIDMAKVYIYTDENDAVEQGGDMLDEYLSSVFEDKIFLISEDSKYLFLTEDESAFVIQEYFEE